MKTKVEERLRKAIDTFFDDEYAAKDASLTYQSETNLLRQNSASDFIENAETLLKISRQVLFFFPGTFLLFNLGLRLTVFTLNPTAGVEFIDPLVLAIGSLMTILGIGSLKTNKHTIIPFSIVSFSIALGIFAEMLGDGLHFYYNYGVYFFPLALTIPFLAKAWIDGRWKDSD